MPDPNLIDCSQFDVLFSVIPTVFKLGKKAAAIDFLGLGMYHESNTANKKKSKSFHIYQLKFIIRLSTDVYMKNS
jgi:hypothetical protein